MVYLGSVAQYINIGQITSGPDVRQPSEGPSLTRSS